MGAEHSRSEVKRSCSGANHSKTGAEHSCSGANHSSSGDEQSRSSAEHYSRCVEHSKCCADHSSGTGTPSTPIEFASHPSDITEFVDAFHDGEEVQFHRLDDIVGGTGSSSLAGRLLNDPELLLVSAELPLTFALVERDAN